VLKTSLCLYFVGVLAVLGNPSAPEKSVIQILNFNQQPVWDAPWRFESVRRGGGSGFVIRGKRIMTNAHVVSWSKQILVKRYQDPRPYLAKVVFVGHDCDLAILEVEDEGFFEGLEPLHLGELPKVRSTVVTYGYPAGGEQISYTRGVVSRIEMQSFVHIGNRSYLTVQTDAAINPGNSGGPVIQDDQVVGVAFQGMPGLENTGFFIPPPVIEHFLKDVEDGTYHGFPQAGIRLVTLQNKAYRALLRLPEIGGGARVDSILPIPTTQELIQDEDVLLQVGDYPVANDGTVIYQDNRVHVAAAFQTAQESEKLPVKLWRKGQELTVALPMHVYIGDRLAGNQYDVPPRYFVYGGMVFTPLSADYLRGTGRNYTDSAHIELVYELYYRRNESPADARAEPIVLATTLAHPVNANHKIQSRHLVDKINGLRIDRLEDVVRAFETGREDQHLIEFTPAVFECLDRADAERANAEILNTYNIPTDRRI
jgi:S1-C subfamily serine protease